MQIYMLQTLQLIEATNQALVNELSNKLIPVRYGEGKIYFLLKEDETL